MSPGWNLLGRYRILVKPLFDNPAFLTHRIFLEAEFLGAQLSVPTVSDCDWLFSNRGRYVEEGVQSRLGMSYQQRQEIFHSGRGTTRKHGEFTIKFKGKP